MEHCRNGVDLLLLETYIWRALPEDLGTEDIYQMIRGRLDTFIRGADMLLPAYGNPCYTLMALDTSERPDVTNLGEDGASCPLHPPHLPRDARNRLVQRRLRQHQMGHQGIHPGNRAQARRDHRRGGPARLRVLRQTVPDVPARESLGKEGRIRRMGSHRGAKQHRRGWIRGPVAVEFLVDGKPVGRQTAASVPAGPNRNHNRAFLKHAVKAAPGSHRFEAEDRLSGRFDGAGPDGEAGAVCGLNGRWGLGIGDWGLGIGDWGLGIGDRGLRCAGS